MKVMTGTVIAGKVEVPAGCVVEGERVVVLALESDAPVRLTPGEEEELLAAVEEIRRGEYVDGDEFLAALRAGLLD